MSSELGLLLAWLAFLTFFFLSLLSLCVLFLLPLLLFLPAFECEAVLHLVVPFSV